MDLGHVGAHAASRVVVGLDGDSEIVPAARCCTNVFRVNPAIHILVEEVSHAVVQKIIFDNFRAKNENGI